MRRPMLVTVLLAALLAAGIATWFHAHPEPAPAAADTGMSPAAREELMRTIGYVQQ